MISLVDKKVLEYITEEEYMNERKFLKDGENKVLYCDDKVRVRIINFKENIYTVITEYGDKPIDEVVKNMITVQA